MLSSLVLIFYKLIVIFPKKFELYFENNNIIHNAKIRKDNRKEFPVYELRYNKKDCVNKIYNLFYNDATIYLERKKNKFEF